MQFAVDQNQAYIGASSATSTSWGACNDPVGSCPLGEKFTLALLRWAKKRHRWWSMTETNGGRRRLRQLLAFGAAIGPRVDPPGRASRQTGNFATALARAIVDQLRPRRA